MQHDHVLKKLKLDPRVGGGEWVSGGSVGKIFANLLLHSWFHLIWYATWPCSEKVELWPFDSTPGFGVGGCRHNTCYHFSAFVIPSNMICNMTIFWKKVEFWSYDHTFRVRGWGWGVCCQNICYHVALFVIPFYLICNMTMFWKSWILTFWPRPLSPPRGSDRGLRSKIAFDMCHIYCNLFLHVKFQ